MIANVKKIKIIIIILIIMIISKENLSIPRVTQENIEPTPPLRFLD